MSLASCSYQCTYIPDAGTYTVTLLGSTGDIVQMYKGSSTSPSCTPNIDNMDKADKPVVKAVLMSSDPTVGDDELADRINNDSSVWMVNGVALEFNNSGISFNGSYNGLFERIEAGEDSLFPHGGLRVLKNLVEAAMGLPLVITHRIAVETGNTTAGAQASYTVRFIQSTGDSTMAEIYCDAGQSFALDDRDGHTSVTAKARLWREGNEVPAADYECRWFLLRDGAWAPKGTAATFTVTRDDVDTFGQIKVECWSKGTDAAMIASDIQTVSDSSDPYVIHPNPEPADGTFRQTGGPDNIRFSPKLESVSGGQVPEGVRYLFTVLSPAGVILNNDNNENTTPMLTYTLPKRYATAINFGPLVNITSVEKTI